MIWMYRSGKPEDPFIPITQTLRIKDGVVLLEEIPDNFQRPTVTHDTITFSEIQSGDPGATNYRIIYKYGIIVFNHVNNGELVTINYFGTGRFFLPANRVYAQIDDENNVTQSLKDLLDDNEAAIEAITTLADLVSQINEFQHMGTYDPAIIYKVRNVVDDNSGNSFMAVQESVGQSLSDTTHWRPIALKGDMHKSVYDQGDIGVVDDSQKLGGQLPSYYEPAFEKNTAFNKDFGTIEGTVCDGGAVGSISSLETSDKTNVVSAINEVNNVLETHKANSTDAHGIDDHVAETAEDDVHGLAGKIIEDFGSNDNGSWVRFGNGLQICWHTAVYGSAELTAGEYTKTWTLPKSFVDRFYLFSVNLTTESRDATKGSVTGQRVHSRSASSADYYLAIATGFYSAASVELFAIGWWK